MYWLCAGAKWPDWVCFAGKAISKPARLAATKAPHPNLNLKARVSRAQQILRPKTTRKKAMKKKKPAASGLPVYFQGPPDPVLQGLRLMLQRMLS